MSKEQNTQIQKALNYVRNIALKQSKQEQQQTLTLLLSAVSSHIRIMLNPLKPAAKKSKKSSVRKPAPIKLPSANTPKPQNPNIQAPTQPTQQSNIQQDLETRRDALAPISPNSTIP